MLDGIKQALERGFIRECQAYMKYLAFSHVAENEASQSVSTQDKQKYLEAMLLFRRVAQEEYGHAFFYFDALKGIGDSLKNLQEALEMEKNDAVEYSISASAARAVGDSDTADIFDRIQAMEVRHIEQFEKLAERFEESWLDDRLRNTG
jgi:rubrerythrin